MAFDHQAFGLRVSNALNRLDFDAWEQFLTEDYVEDYPQSGEVIRGRKNARAIRERYPGGFGEETMDLSTARLSVPPERWVRTPTFTFVRAEGSGNVGTAAYRGTYPDGSLWWVITFYELRGEQISRATLFFAPTFDAPDWRKPYREPALRGKSA